MVDLDIEFVVRRTICARPEPVVEAPVGIRDFLSRGRKELHQLRCNRINQVQIRCSITQFACHQIVVLDEYGPDRTAFIRVKMCALKWVPELTSRISALPAGVEAGSSQCAQFAEIADSFGRARYA